MSQLSAILPGKLGRTPTVRLGAGYRCLVTSPSTSHRRYRWIGLYYSSGFGLVWFGWVGLGFVGGVGRTA
ncbi:mCG147616 [Mus musculus]|nr:mCG147616 [Mus musculus]